MVVATATIALQRQLIDRDLPRLVSALAPLLGQEPAFAILKGRRNYLCLHRQRGGPADDPQDGLFDPAARRSAGGPSSPLGRQVKRLHEWAEETTTGDRDELVPGVPEAAWRQVSVSAQECIGAQRCPFGSRCFAEKAREAAAKAHVVVTNHALLAIDATSDVDVLPGHDVVIVDEAHDLVDRVTSATTGELSGAAVDAAARRAARLIESAAAEGGAPAVADQLRHAAAALTWTSMTRPRAGWTCCPTRWPRPCASVHDAAKAAAEAITASAASLGTTTRPRLAAARMALASLETCSGPPAGSWARSPAELDAARRWCGSTGRSPRTRGAPPTLRVAPLEVGAGAA